MVVLRHEREKNQVRVIIPLPSSSFLFISNFRALHETQGGALRKRKSKC